VRPEDASGFVKKKENTLKKKPRPNDPQRVYCHHYADGGWHYLPEQPASEDDTEYIRVDLIDAKTELSPASSSGLLDAVAPTEAASDELRKEIEFSSKALQNTDDPFKFAEYLYARCSEYIGPKHNEWATRVIISGIIAVQNRKFIRANGASR
jgi:hypothetical protein